VIGADTRINSIALQQQLSLHGVVPAPNTILNGVQDTIFTPKMISLENNFGISSREKSVTSFD
jgi:hypothetical protein